MNCDSEISDSLTLHSRIYLQVSTYMHPLYSKDRDWKKRKEIKKCYNEKDSARASATNIKYKSYFKRIILNTIYVKILSLSGSRSCMRITHNFAKEDIWQKFCKFLFLLCHINSQRVKMHVAVQAERLWKNISK